MQQKQTTMLLDNQRDVYLLLQDSMLLPAVFNHHPRITLLSVYILLLALWTFVFNKHSPFDWTMCVYGI